MSDQYSAFYIIFTGMLPELFITLVFPVLTIGIFIKWMRNLALYDRE